MLIVSTQFNMAVDQSGRVHPNNEFRERLMDKVHVNVTETGKLAQQLLKSSRSHEVNSRKSLAVSTIKYDFNNTYNLPCYEEG